MKRDLISIADFSPGEMRKLFDLARKLKEETKQGQPHATLFPYQTLAFVFEKPSLRTRVTFEVAMTQLGGHACYLAPADIQMGKRETVRDVAVNLSRWVNLLVARTFAHKTVQELAKYATVPVINALSDLEHPCQALADFLTILEHKEGLEGRTLAYIGDGNNVCHSLMLGASALGMNTKVTTPKGHEPAEAIVAAARSQAKITNARFELYTDPGLGLKNADIVYTDVWASMGQEEEAENRRKTFRPYQVNNQLLSMARPDARVMHCLPAHRGEEIAEDVLDGPQSIVLDQAENRLHIQKAVLVKLLTRG